MSAAVAVQDGPEHERRLADLEQRNTVHVILYVNNDKSGP